MSEVYIRSQNKEKLYRLGGNYACVEYGEYEDIKKKRGLTEGYCILGIRVTDYTGKVSETDTESGAEHE